MVLSSEVQPMIRTFALLPFLGCIAASAQSYHPLIRPDAYWDVQHADNSQICNASGGYQYFFQGDTVVAATEYTIVRAHPIISLVPIPYCPPYVIDSSITTIAVLMREDTIARTVHVFDPNSQSDQLLYDFTLQAGDTLHSEYAGAGATLIVDSVGTIELGNGAVRNIHYLDNDQFYIESIGGSQGLWFSMQLGISFAYVPLCVRENGVTLWGDQCFGYLGSVGIEPLEAQPIGIEVFPNPANDHCTIEFSHGPADLQLIDATGRIVRQWPAASSPFQLDLSSFHPGIYLIRTEHADQQGQKKVIIQ